PRERVHAASRDADPRVVQREGRGAVEPPGMTPPTTSTAVTTPEETPTHPAAALPITPPITQTSLIPASNQRLNVTAGTSWTLVVEAFLDSAVDSANTRRAYDRHLRTAFN